MFESNSIVLKKKLSFICTYETDSCTDSFHFNQVAVPCHSQQLLELCDPPFKQTKPEALQNVYIYLQSIFFV